MIPKIIHYCWLSNDAFPEHIQYCVDSWKKYLQDYDFILWNFDRFPKGKSLWVDQAFEYKKYAFAADYIRLYALYNYGGIYLDCDVEVIKPFDKYMELSTMICWQKDVPGLEVAAFGVEKGLPWIKESLDYYENRPFIKNDGGFDVEVLPEVIEKRLIKQGYSLNNVNSLEEAKCFTNPKAIPVLPSDYFSPKSYLTKEISITKNTVSVHHFDGSWKSESFFDKAEAYIKRW